MCPLPRPGRSSSRSQRRCVRLSTPIHSHCDAETVQVLPHDTYGRDWGLFIGEKLPYVPGSNIAGTVTEVGEGMTAVQPGDPVFGLSDLATPTPDQAGLQEYALLDADALAKTPPGLSHDQAATLPVNLMTAWTALFSARGLGWPAPLPSSSEPSPFPTDESSLVVLGAGASNGRFAVQLAALAGIGTIVAVAGPAAAAALRDMGATHVLDRHLPAAELAARVHAVVGTQGARRVYHAHGYDYALDVAVLPTEGPSVLRSVHPVEGEEAARLRAQRPLCDAAMVEMENATLGPHKEEFWAMVPGWVEEGKVRPGTYRVIEGLEKVAEIDEALDGYRDGRGGQVIVHP